jgi:replicative DNA helicase
MEQKETDLKVIKNRSYNQPFMSEVGKLPPQAVELEEAVLGALLIDKEAINDVVDILSVNSFYKDNHQKIYRAILKLFGASTPIDILTVCQELKKTGELEIVGGAYYVSSLTERVGSSANIETHARIISQKHIQRELIRVSSNTIKKAYEDSTDVFDLLDEAEKNLFAVAEGNIRKDFDNMDNLMKKALEQIENASMSEEGVSGVPSGFTELDKVTSGWQKSDLIIVAARPGMGKTAFVLSMARNIALDFKRPLAIFSLEMPSVQLVLRLISSETGIRSESIKKGSLKDHEWAQLHQNVEKLSQAPIFIDDTPALSIFELRAKCRRLKAQYDIQMVVIDYLQLMSGGSESKGNREQEISAISRSLKSLAKELEVPVIALSQLSRAVETRGGDKKPQLSDLRESGAIEQDADMVIFLYRPQYYKIETFEDGSPTDGIGQVIIAKHRNGSLEDVNLRFIGHLAKFDNLEGGYDPGNAGINPSVSFDDEGQSFMTVGSKMNNDIKPSPPSKSIDDFFNSDEEIPF